MTKSNNSKANAALTAVHTLATFANTIATVTPDLLDKAKYGVDLRSNLKEYKIEIPDVLEELLADEPIVLLKSNQPLDPNALNLTFPRSGRESQKNMALKDDNDIWCWGWNGFIICIGDVIVISWPEKAVQ